MGIDMQQFELLGYVKYFDDKNLEKFLVTLMTPCTPEMTKAGRVGFNVTKQWLPVREYRNFDPSMINKKFYLSSGMNTMGQMELLGLIPVPSGSEAW